MVKNIWKIIAIIFMVLFLLETIYILWAWNIGTKMVEDEYKCAYNICEGGVYTYDFYEDMCYCWDEKDNNNLIKQEYMK